ncbi:MULTISPECIES: DUF3325 domain-containing protein [Luteibacter]|jgi:Protein of unknown function (DUF3325)|uniref:DUF3325 domain-containing protein n=1 Tax=Luteibacter sp. dw_328 TaxID=2719796 RepID=UPI0007BF50B4|nr:MULTISPECIES: DUF3325 domain-containing protein [Luteibacter]
MSLLLAIVGFACLAGAMNRHHAEVIGGKPPRSRAYLLRLAGSVALGALLIVEMTHDGAAFGALLAFGYASAGAGTVLLTLTLLSRLRVRR